MGVAESEARSAKCVRSRLVVNPPILLHLLETRRRAQSVIGSPFTGLELVPRPLRVITRVCIAIAPALRRKYDNKTPFLSLSLHTLY